MPNDLFRAVAAGEPSNRFRKSPVAVVSLLVHALVIAAVATWQLADIGILPTPHQALAYSADALHITVADADLPRAPRPGAPAADSSAPVVIEPTVAAPVVAPQGISPETDRNGWRTGRDSGADEVERAGVGVPDGIGVAVPAPAAPAPQAPIHLHSGIRTPRKLADVAPVYPAIARSAHVEGIVIIEATIDAQGNVASARLLRSIPLLDAAALDAVRQWKFTPTLLNGVPVPIIMTVTVNFKLTS